ncbi:MAG: hypothetical protein UX23_C0011G0020 [Parcubacteria group bacterium GW2011_GWB1_45_9]|nr:MAG: hypothetical protein UX23_C0011G0020 [Parcubacteria group bacterium GW2011_GWB1_45_9]
MKIWMKEFKTVFIHIIYYRAGKRNVELERLKYPFSTHLTSLMAIALISVITLTAITILTAAMVNNFILGPGDDFQASVKNNILMEGPSPITRQVDEGSRCFGEDSWQLWFGEMSRDVRDDTHYFLPQDVYHGLFKYSDKVAAASTCTFRFVPRGKRAINYVISFDDFYQVVVGDNDRWTVSVRASEAVDEALKPVEESKTGKTRPRLTYSIKLGSTVTVVLVQRVISEERYEVKISVTYTPDNSSQTRTKTEEFSWEFNSSPIINLRSLDLSVGLIRGINDSSHIGISFINPEL